MMTIFASNSKVITKTSKMRLKKNKTARSACAIHKHLNTICLFFYMKILNERWIYREIKTDI